MRPTRLSFAGKAQAPDRGYQLTSPARLVPWLNDNLKPTILVGKSSVALASNLERAREASSAEIAANSPWLARGELQKAIDGMPENWQIPGRWRPANSTWPTLLEQLPGEVQLLATVFGGIGDDQASAGGALTGGAGHPASRGFRVRIIEAQIPRADQVRRNLFPSVMAGTVDDPRLPSHQPRSLSPGLYRRKSKHQLQIERDWRQGLSPERQAQAECTRSGKLNPADGPSIGRYYSFELPVARPPPEYCEVNAGRPQRAWSGRRPPCLESSQAVQRKKSNNPTMKAGKLRHVLDDGFNV